MISNDELLALIEAREAESYGYGDGALSERRAAAIDRFLSEPYGNEQEGRSQVVATDLRDTVLWAMPQLMRVFLGGDKLVQFDPRGPEDEAQAHTETEYINWLALERNDAFGAFSAVIQDALLLGTGYAKVWWDVSEDVQTETYYGKTDDELALLLNDSEVEVVEHSAYDDPAQSGGVYVDPMTGAQIEIPPPTLHDVKMRRTRRTERAKYGAVPPEELLIHKTVRSISLQDAAFVEHRRLVTLSELREMGHKVRDDEFTSDEWLDSSEEQARNRFEEHGLEGIDADPSMRRLLYRECYLRIDRDGDGIAELSKVCVAGMKVLEVEDAECVLFAAFGAIPFGHRHHGLSFYDLLAEIQLIKTALLRGMLDSTYLAIAPRVAADVSRVNIDDLLVSRAGAVVRTQGDPAGAVMPLVTPDVGQNAMAGIQYVDHWKTDASGINPYFQGGAMLDSSAMNKTASGVSQLITQAQSRIEAIARALSDGVRDLFLLLHQTTLKHATRAEKVKLMGQWVPIDPREWVKRSDLSVQVALGAGSKEMQTHQLQQLLAMQTQLLQVGLVKPENLYRTASRLTQAMGFKNAEEFWSDPSRQPPQQPQPNPQIVAEQIKAQTQMQIKSAEMQAQAADDQRQYQIEQQRLALELQQEQFKAQLQAELEREKARLQAETQIAVAQIKAQVDAEAKRTDAMLRGMEREQDVSTITNAGKTSEGVIGVLREMQQMQVAMGEHLVKSLQPKRIVRDESGRPIGVAGADGSVQEIVRDASGRVGGIGPVMQ